MSEKSDNITEVPVKDNSEQKVGEPIIDELKEQLEKEKNAAKLCEEKLKRSLADFDNLQKRTKVDIEKNVNSKIDELLLKFLSVYDDFIRARDTLSKQKVNVEGLKAIIKNMNSLLSEYGITPIVALGEIFDPNVHEAVSITEDPLLDDGTITSEIKKGYKLNNRILRPSVVEISKKPNTSERVDEENG